MNSNFSASDFAAAPIAAKPVKVRVLKGDVKDIHDLLVSRRDNGETPVSLAYIVGFTGIPMKSVGSRLRDLRKPAFGSLNVVRHGNGSKATYSLGA